MMRDPQPSSCPGLSFLIYKMGVWPAEGVCGGRFVGVCELLARPLPAIPAGATRGRGASAQKPALTAQARVDASRRSWNILSRAGFQALRNPRVCADGRVSALLAGGRAVTQARGPQFSRGSVRGLGNSRGAASIFTRAPLKIVPALGAEPEIAAPR